MVKSESRLPSSVTVFGCFTLVGHALSFYNVVYLVMFGSWLLRGPFSRGSEWRLLSDRGVRASHRGASPVAERRP